MYVYCYCHCLVAKSSPTLLRPHGLTVACQAPLSMAFLRHEYWSGLPFPSPEDGSSWPRKNLWLLNWQVDSLLPSHQGSHTYMCVCVCVCVCILFQILFPYAAAAAKSLQSCLTLCDPIDGSPQGSPTPGILQARTLEWVAISFSNAWKWKVKVKSCPTLSNPMDCSPPGSSIHGIFPARVLEWGAIAFSSFPL